MTGASPRGSGTRPDGPRAGGKQAAGGQHSTPPPSRVVSCETTRFVRFWTSVGFPASDPGQGGDALPLTGPRTEEQGRRGGALQVQVDVVLPGEADAAVQLDG